MGWSLSDLGIAGFTVIGVVPAFILIGVMFLIGGLGLYFAGLVSAMIYFLAAVGIIWFMKVLHFFSHPVGYLIGAVVLIAMPLLGWGRDNLTWLAMMPSPAEWIISEPKITLYTNSYTGDALSFVLSIEFLGTMMSSIGAVLGAASIIMMKRKKHRKSR